MKRVLLPALCLLLLLMPSAMGEEPAPEPLFPAYDEAAGKWGYIDRSGTFVIPARFDGAGDFRGGYAVVKVWPEGFVPAEDPWEWPDCSGVIDRSGNIVLEPDYTFDSGYDGQTYGGWDKGIWYVTRRHDLIWNEDETETIQENLVGFFDIPSGCFSGLKWRDIWPWVSSSRLIPVKDQNGEAGYADRTTGELVIPCRYFDSDPSCFYGGVAAVALEDEDGDPGDFFLIDESGETILLPEGIHAVQYQGAFHERIMIQDDVRRYGYADLSGQVVIPPQYERADAFQETPLGITAVVQFEELDWGIIDREGNVLTRGIAAQDWSGPHFYNGIRSEKTGDNTYTLFDMMGNTVMSLTVDHIVSLGTPMENGLCWFSVDEKGDETHWYDRRYGLADLQGRIVTQPEWISPDWSTFSEGFAVVVQMIDGERKLGYLNDFGELALPCVYNQAGDFENGLAYVRIGDRCGYIDKTGQEVFFWDSEDDEW